MRAQSALAVLSRLASVDMMVAFFAVPYMIWNSSGRHGLPDDYNFLLSMPADTGFIASKIKHDVRTAVTVLTVFKASWCYLSTWYRRPHTSHQGEGAAPRAEAAEGC